jgi:hypothetical protein
VFRHAKAHNTADLVTNPQDVPRAVGSSNNAALTAATSAADSLDATVPPTQQAAAEDVTAAAIDRALCHVAKEVGCLPVCPLDHACKPMHARWTPDASCNTCSLTGR